MRPRHFMLALALTGGLAVAAEAQSSSNMTQDTSIAKTRTATTRPHRKHHKGAAAAKAEGRMDAKEARAEEKSETKAEEKKEKAAAKKKP